MFICWCHTCLETLGHADGLNCKPAKAFQHFSPGLPLLWRVRERLSNFGWGALLLALTYDYAVRTLHFSGVSHNIVDVPVLNWLAFQWWVRHVALKLSVQIPVSGSSGNAVRIAFTAFFSRLSTFVTGLRTASQLRLMGPVVHSRTLAKAIL